MWSKKFNEILRVPPVPWLFFAQIKVLSDLLPGSTIPLLSRKSLTGVGKAGCPLPGWGCRGEVAQWISAESCLVGEGHRKGAVLKVLPSCCTASWHLEMMAAQPSWRTQAVISRTFILLPDGTWYLLSGWMSAQLKTVASSLASMPPGHLLLLSRGSSQPVTLLLRSLPWLSSASVRPSQTAYSRPFMIWLLASVCPHLQPDLSCPCDLAGFCF